MTLWKFAWRYLWFRPLGTLLNLLLLGMGLGSMAFLILVSAQLTQAFERDLAGIDVVVGAKGSPLQLILSGVLHLDVPPGNISLASVKALAQHPLVDSVIPLSLGDSLGAYRIVGTTPDYLRHYQARFAQGGVWTAPMQAVLGAQAARELHLAVGEHFAGAHGLAAGGHVHEDQRYTVTGILAPSGSVLDRLVLTDLASVWKVHEGHGAHDADEEQNDHEQHAPDAKPEALNMAQREVTMALVQYKTPLAAMSLPRYINSQTTMQAASPAVEISRLLHMLGLGTDVLRAFAAVLLLTAGLSVFIALWSAVRERQADLTLLRMLGARPAKMVALLLCEALWLGLLAAFLGVLLGQVFTQLLAVFLQLDHSVLVGGMVWPAGLLWVPCVALVVSLLAALLPALGAYRLSVLALLQSH